MARPRIAPQDKLHTESVSLNAEERDMLKSMSKNTNESKSNIMRKAIKEYLEKHKYA